jgi:CRISPR-associated endonuclease Csn1
MHAETVSGKVFLKRIKQSHVTMTKAIEEIELIVDKEVKKQLATKIKQYPNNPEGLKKHLKAFPVMIDGKAIDKVQIYEKIEATATRKTLDITFDEKRIQKITDTGIQKILLKHLQQEMYQNAIDENGKKVPAHEVAFSENGLDELSKNITSLNNGKKHQPIKKIRVFEESSRFFLGNTGNKKDKFVETASGTNLFFAIYKDNNGKRNYKTIPLNEIIESQKLGAFEKLKPNECSVPNTYIDEKTQELSSLLFYLNPNDLVFVPTIEEIENSNDINIQNFKKEQVQRVYKFTDSSDTTCNFIPASSSSLIFSITKKDQEKIGLNYPIQNEYGLGSPQSKNQNSLNGIQIKSFCWKLEVDRLGKIKRIVR